MAGRKAWLSTVIFNMAAAKEHEERLNSERTKLGKIDPTYPQQIILSDKFKITKQIQPSMLPLAALHKIGTDSLQK